MNLEWIDALLVLMSVAKLAGLVNSWTEVFIVVIVSWLFSSIRKACELSWTVNYANRMKEINGESSASDKTLYD